MNLEELSEQLTLFNEEELFYKSYYYAKQDAKQYDNFLSELKKEPPQNRKLVIPEILGDSTPAHYVDEDYFDETPRYYVRLLKYNRYTPVYSHSHDFFEILYIWNGICRHRILQNDLHMKKGDFCIIAPSISHSVEVNDDNSIVIQILLRRSTMELLLMDIFQSNNVLTAFFFNSLFTRQTTGYLLFHTANTDVIRDLIANMYFSQCSKDSYSNIVNNHFMIITFIELIRIHGEDIETPPSVKNSDEHFQLLYYMMNNYLTISLKDVAEKFNYNTSYCSQYIKHLTGNTYSQLMWKFRFEKASRLLTDTNMNIQEISNLLGYGYPEGFVRAFKKETHMTPTEYRKHHRSY